MVSSIHYSLLLLFAFLILATGSSPSFDVIFSTNATTVQVGHPFTATCKLAGKFTAPPGEYSIRFQNSNGQPFLVFDYPAQRTNTTRQPKISIPALPSHPLPTIDVHPLHYNQTDFALSITPKYTTHSRAYSCQFRRLSSLINSHPVSISVIPTPRVHFTTKATKVTLGFSFTANCFISNFEANPQSEYVVAFYSRSDGLLGSFIHKNGVILLSFTNQSNSVLVHHGKVTVFPVFELQIREKSQTNQELWCAFEVPDLEAIESNHWILPSIVRFTSSKPSNDSRSGNCALDDFDLEGREYSVKFWTDLGPKANNLLAAYSVTPNEIVEFDAQTVTPWTEITFDRNSSYPSFSICGQSSSSSFASKTWWCTLEIAEASNATAVVYKSKEESLN